MGRKRISNRELPERVYYKHGAYYYVPLEAIHGFPKWIRLGTTKSEMYSFLADLQIRPTGGVTVEKLWKDFSDDHLPSLSPATQTGYQKNARQFLKVFGHMHPDEIKTSDIARYLLVRGKKAKTCANNEVRCLSSLYKYAVSLGFAESNPCRGAPTHKISPRDRYIDDFELSAFRSVCNEFMDSYVELKYLTGLRQTDMLLLTMDNIKEDGLYVRPSKTRNSTGEARIYEYTSDLLLSIERVKNLPRPKSASHLFCNKNGKPFIDNQLKVSGFNNLWNKTMSKALRNTSLSIRFQEKDIRAKTATDADDDGQNATEILGHENPRTTQIYLRSKKIKRVKPLTIDKEKK